MEEQSVTIELARKYWEDNEKYKVAPRKLSSNSEEDVIPEIKDIYDQIYGIVRSKRVFYEGKKTEREGKTIHVTKSEDAEDHRENDLVESIVSSVQLIEGPDLDLLKSCEDPCNRCLNAEFVDDRNEVLTEINACLRLELESTKQDLKREVAKNNELNYEIANIESALEAYYKEAKHQRSVLGTLYSAVKSYGPDQRSYTHKRVAIIANYIESLKNKLEYQDMVIKNNFADNPYSTDLEIKHEETLKQLDNLSRENEELKEDIKRRETAEMEIIKELNRQKFQIENKCEELEDYYKREITKKDELIKDIEEKHNHQLKQWQNLLEDKDKNMVELERAFTSKTENYKWEILVVHRKWKELKMLVKQENKVNTFSNDL